MRQRVAYPDLHDRPVKIIDKHDNYSEKNHSNRVQDRHQIIFTTDRVDDISKEGAFFTDLANNDSIRNSTKPGESALEKVRSADFLPKVISKREKLAKIQKDSEKQKKALSIKRAYATKITESKRSSSFEISQKYRVNIPKNDSLSSPGNLALINNLNKVDSMFSSNKNSINSFSSPKKLLPYNFSSYKVSRLKNPGSSSTTNLKNPLPKTSKQILMDNFLHQSELAKRSLDSTDRRNPSSRSDSSILMSINRKEKFTRFSVSQDKLFKVDEEDFSKLREKVDKFKINTNKFPKPKAASQPKSHQFKDSALISDLQAIHHPQKLSVPESSKSEKTRSPSPSVNGNHQNQYYSPRTDVVTLIKHKNYSESSFNNSKLKNNISEPKIRKPNDGSKTNTSIQNSENSISKDIRYKPSSLLPLTYGPNNGADGERKIAPKPLNNDVLTSRERFEKIMVKNYTLSDFQNSASIREKINDIHREIRKSKRMTNKKVSFKNS